MISPQKSSDRASDAGWRIHRAVVRAMSGGARCLRYLTVAVVILFSIHLCAQSCVMDPDHYGLKADGIALNTQALQAYIDDAAKGGPLCTVWLRPGSYRTGSIFLKSGVTLRLDKSVTILGSQNIADYPLRPTRVAGIEMVWPAALINVYEQDHAAITGEGTIDGDGKVFWDSYWALRKIEEPKGLRWASDYDARRPRMIVIYNSHDVTVGGGLMLRRSGFWTVHICYSHDVTVDGVTIRNNDGANHGPSTDGIDIDSSKKVLVAHADIENNDDALCLKAGRDADGLRVNRPTEDVVIRDSVIRVGAAGVTFGSETSGGFRNVEIYNLTVYKPVPYGILFKSAHTRGGWMEDVRIHDITLLDVPTVLQITMNWNPSYSYAKIPDDVKDPPPYYKTLATPVPADKGIAHFHDVHIWNVKATGAKTAFDVSGMTAAPLTRFAFDHLDIAAQTAGHIAGANDWTFQDISLKIADNTTVKLTDDHNITGLPGESKNVSEAR